MLALARIVAVAVVGLVLAAPTFAQEKPTPVAPDGGMKTPPPPPDGGMKPPPPGRQVAPPPVLSGRQLPIQPPGPPKAPPVETVDGLDAALVIDGTPISREAYGDFLIAEFGETSIEPFVLNFLFERRARELGVTPTAQAIDEAFQFQRGELLQKRFRGDEGQMRAFLIQNNLTPEQWEAGMKARLAKEILKKVVVRADRDSSDAAVTREFESKYGPGGVKRSGRYIYISTGIWTSNLFTQADYDQDREAIDAGARKRAEDARQKLAAGADFAALATQVSEDPMAEKGGDHGRYWKNRFGAEANERLAALKVGETSEVLKTPRGYIIARATAKKDGWEIRARQILVLTQVMGNAPQTLKDRKLADAREKLLDLKKRIAAGALSFEEAAATHSDDASSKTKGGDLGTFTTGTSMLPEIEDALIALEPGAMSEPIVTPYGVHLLQLVEKKRKPEQDHTLMSIMLFSTEFLKEKERRLKGTIEAKARELAEGIAARLRGGEDPAALAKTHSDDLVTREANGKIQEPLNDKFPAEAATAFRAMQKPKDVTLVQSNSGWHVLMLEESATTVLDDAKRTELRKDLRERDPSYGETRDYVERMRAAAKVQKSRFEGGPRR